MVLSIKAGKVLPSTLLRKLGNNSHKNRLYRAFRELGRVVSTVFRLRYISDIQLREQINATTNKVEAYNGFTKWVFFGGEGVITENDPEEQEKRIKYKDLVSNIISFRNVVDITYALRELKREGYEVIREDVAALSPYLTRHIKRFGDYYYVGSSVTTPKAGTSSQPNSYFFTYLGWRRQCSRFWRQFGDENIAAFQVGFGQKETDRTFPLVRSEASRGCVSMQTVRTG